MSYYQNPRFKMLSKLMSVGLSFLLVTACSSTVNNSDISASMVNLTGEDEVYNFHTHQKINDYTDRLAHDLFRNMHNKKLAQPILVTSFVNFDETLQESTKLGNLVSESLLGHMQEYDLDIVDAHLTGQVNITPIGDFVFSRDQSDIVDTGKVSYVLAGVIVASEGGFTINARIIELKTKKIISTASTFIPFFVVEVI